uniref:Uncharacterized protein n=1 Tax=Falco tinnunculus TaxID=100819 RepID=A0A8C4UC39_FALTI
MGRIPASRQPLNGAGVPHPGVPWGLLYPRAGDTSHGRCFQWQLVISISPCHFEQLILTCHLELICYANCFTSNNSPHLQSCGAAGLWVPAPWLFWVPPVSPGACSILWPAFWHLQLPAELFRPSRSLVLLHFPVYH